MERLEQSDVSTGASLTWFTPADQVQLGVEPQFPGVFIWMRNYMYMVA